MKQNFKQRKYLNTLILIKAIIWGGGRDDFEGSLWPGEGAEKRVGFDWSPVLPGGTGGKSGYIKSVTVFCVPVIASGEVWGSQGAGHACSVKQNEFPD